MYTRFFIASWALTGLFSQPALAQLAAQAAQPPLAFQSAMEGYQPYTDDPTVDWKDANDTTARIGGWRAYAKEASATTGQAAPQDTPDALPPAAPATPTPPTPKP